MKTEFAVLASFENYIGIRTQITVERSIESESYARILGERFKRLNPKWDVGCHNLQTYERTWSSYQIDPDLGENYAQTQIDRMEKDDAL